MGSAYTPGLCVSADATIRRDRRLPLRGEVLVEVGRTVRSADVVATTALPGKVHAINAAGALNVHESELATWLRKRVGDSVVRGEILAERSALFGWLRTRVEAPVDGVLESIGERTGRVLLREAPTPVEVRAYIDGTVVDVRPSEGCTVEATGTLVQGIFGLGGETEGVVRVVATAEEQLRPAHFTEAHRGSVVIGGSRLTRDAYEAAAHCGVHAVVTGGMPYRDIREIVGFEIGVAITGNERLPTTVVITEGFGTIAMATATYELLASCDGKRAAVNGATQIRAGVLRPEVFVGEGAPRDRARIVQHELTVGAPIRIIRAPWFGALARVAELPVEPVRLESETRVRVLIAELADGSRCTVPRANVERIEGR